jgi:hypothetical protein
LISAFSWANFYVKRPSFKEVIAFLPRMPLAGDAGFLPPDFRPQIQADTGRSMQIQKDLATWMARGTIFLYL